MNSHHYNQYVNFTFWEYSTVCCADQNSSYLCGLVVRISCNELLSRAAIGGVRSVSVGQRGGGRVGEGAGVRGRGGGGGGLGLQAVEGVAARCKHHSYPGQKPAPELILVNKHTSKIPCFTEASSQKPQKQPS